MYNAFLTAALTASVSTVVGSAVSAVIASLIARKKSKKAIDEVNSARYAAIENGLQSMRAPRSFDNTTSIPSGTTAPSMQKKPWSRSTMPITPWAAME